MKLLIENINKINKLKYLLIYFKIKKYKKIRISHLIRKNDKYRLLLGEHLLIKGLKKYYNINYKNIEIEINEYGKPYIKNSNIYYNISHSNDYVICALDKTKVGIDIEKIRPINKNDINQFATEKEKKYIFKNKEHFLIRSFEIYTLKEAYFKMKGTNLNNIKNIEFSINNNITCGDPNVNIKLIKDIDNYIIAICTKKK